MRCDGQCGQVGVIRGVGGPITFDPDNPGGLLTDLFNIGLGYGQQALGINQPAATTTPAAAAAAPASGMPTWLIPVAVAGIAAVVLMKRK